MVINIITFIQGCRSRSGSELDPDSIGSGQWIQIRIRNPNPDPGGQKQPRKVEKIQNFHVLKCWKFSFVSWRLLLYSILDVLYGGLGIGKLQFLIQTNYIFSSCKFFPIFGQQNPWIRIGVQPEMLDPDTDPSQMNTDPQPCIYHASSNKY